MKIYNEYLKQIGYGRGGLFSIYLRNFVGEKWTLWYININYTAISSSV